MLPLRDIIARNALQTRLALAERRLQAMSDAMRRSHGVEAVREESDPISGPVVALYVNVGDVHSPTTVYDVSRDCYDVTSLADWIERREARAAS